MDDRLSNPKGDSRKLITYVKDRAGHDLRYAIDATKIQNELGFTPSVSFEEGLANTIDWYLNNKSYYKSFSKKDIIRRLGNYD